MSIANNKAIRAIRRANDFLAVITFALIACIVLLQVVFRYAFHTPLRWSEEMARYLQIWMIMLGGAIAMRSKSHLAIDILTASFPPKVKRAVGVVVYVIVIVFFLIVTVFGAQLVVKTASQLSPAMSINMSMVYAALPVGGCLILMESIINLIESLTQKDERK